ncbi:non-ribosomal peptide synthetase, partial [bacterium]|nr:non-ribosomal peptide synthetase [bacterium]
KIEGLEKEVIEVIPVIQRTQHLPLSSAQKRLWFLEQIHTGEKSIYNIPITYQLDRDPEINNLESAVNTLIQRHESLRTIFKSRDGIPYQEIKSSLNLKISTEKAHPDALQDILKTEACTRFDLETGPLQRIKLLDIGENQKILVITMHHIISDGWSIGIMIKELNTLYKHYASGNTLDLKQLSIQYADYSSWKDKQLNEKDTSYWLERLDGFEDLELPTDFRRQSNQPNSGAHFRFKLDKVLLKKITTIASRNNTTLFTLLFSAFNILLKRYSGQDDIICGTPVANRNLKETEDIIGFFVNTLALRNNLSGNLNFMDLLETINKNCILDFEHQDIDFEQVVDGLNIDRSTGRSPVFQVMFILQNKNDRINIDFPGVSSKLIHFETTISKFDLTLDLQEGIDEIIGEFEYDTRLFKKETIERLSSHYLTLLESIVQTPEAKIDDLSMMTPEEQNYVLNSWNRSDKSFP